MAVFHVGRVMPVAQGEWDAEKAYRIGDVVRYLNATYWVRKDDLSGVKPKKYTDENYQLLVSDGGSGANRYLDLENGGIVDFIGEDPRETDLIRKIRDEFRLPTLFPTVEDFEEACRKGYCVTITGVVGDAESGYPDEVLNAGEEITLIAVQLDGESAAVLSFPTKYVAFSVASDSAGGKSVAREVGYGVNNGKRSVRTSVWFSKESGYFGDFGSGFDEHGYRAEISVALPESDCVVLLPDGDPDNDDRFRKAEITVGNAEYGIESTSYGVRSVLKLTLLMHNREYGDQSFYVRAVAL